MTDTRMNKLLSELNLPKNSVYIADSNSILKRVESKLEKTEVRIARGISVSKALALVVIVVLMLALSIVAFGKDGVIHKIITIFEESETEMLATEEKEADAFLTEKVEDVTEEVTEVPTEEETELKKIVKQSAIFEKYHQEDGEKAEEYVTEIYESVEDSDFIMTLNEVMGDNKNVYLTVTIEAKSSEARTMLMNESHPKFAAEAYDEVLGWVGVSAGIDEAVNERREYSKTFTMHIFGDTRLANGYEKMRITCRSFSMYMRDEEYVYFDIETKKDIIEFELSGQSFEGGYFYLTPMSVEITAPKEETEKYAPQARNLNTFFKFKNGKIKTFNQVAGFHGSYSKTGTGDLYKYSAGTKNYLDLNTIESIIVKDIEYKVDNPSEYTSASVPDRLRPFVANDYRDENGYYYLCTLKELTNRIGVEYIYDADGILEYRYDGKVYRVEAGNGLVMADGKEVYSLHLPPSLNQNGEIIVGAEFVTYVIGTRIGWIEGTEEMLAVP